MSNQARTPTPPDLAFVKKGRQCGTVVDLRDVLPTVVGRAAGGAATGCNSNAMTKHQRIIVQATTARRYKLACRFMVAAAAARLSCCCRYFCCRCRCRHLRVLLCSPLTPLNVCAQNEWHRMYFVPHATTTSTKLHPNLHWLCCQQGMQRPHALHASSGTQSSGHAADASMFQASGQVPGSNPSISFSNKDMAHCPCHAAAPKSN
jgi:hypothetical protein